MLNTIATDLTYTSTGWPTGIQLAFALTRPDAQHWDVHFATSQMQDVDLEVVIRLVGEPIFLGMFEYKIAATITFTDGTTKTVTGAFDSRTGTATFR